MARRDHDRRALHHAVLRLRVGTSTIGQRLALRAALFAELAADSGSYLALSGLLTRLVEVLGLADEEMPLYPAVGGPR